jgi:hypothetical protein
LSDDLDGDDDFLGDDVVDAPPIIKKDRKTRKKKSFDNNLVRRSTRVRFKPSKFQ